MNHLTRPLLGLIALLFIFSSAQAQPSANTILDKNKGKAAIIEQLIKKHISLGHLKNSYFHPLIANTYGVPIRNPFTKAPANVSIALAQAGINLSAMSRYKAIYVTGKFASTQSPVIINTDPNTILVIGNGIKLWAPILSRGPVVVLESASEMGGIKSSNLLWFSDKTSLPLSKYSLSMGLPLVIKGTNPNHSFGLNLYSAAEEAKATSALLKKAK